MSKPMTEARLVPQAISASYIEQLIEVNEQALASFEKKTEEVAPV